MSLATELAVSRYQRKLLRGSVPGRALLIGVCFAILALIALVYNRELLRASMILAHDYERPIVLHAYERFFGYPVKREDLTITGSAGAVQIRVYAPQGTRNAPPMVMVHGLVPQGNRHIYMDDMAEHLARLGFRVVLPTLPGETHFEMRASDLSVIADTVRWTARQTHQQITLAGNSFSGGLIIAAAAQPSIAGMVKLLFCNSGYYDLDRIGRYYIGDRVLGPDGKPYHGIPPGPLFIASEYLDDLVPPEDIPHLRAAIDGVNQNDGDALPDAATVLAGLTAREKQEFQQLAAPDTEFKMRYRAVLQRHHEEIAAISPSSVLGRIRIPLYVLHSSDDPVLPSGEVDWIRTATRGRPEVHILVSPWLGHVAVGRPASAWQKFQVIRFCARMLAEAERMKPLASQP